MGLALLLIIWLITVAGSYFFIAKTWWMPAAAAAGAAAIDQQFHYTFIAMGVVFVAAQFGLGLFVWRYRERPGTTAEYSHGNTTLEIAWTSLTAVLFFGLAIGGAKIWAEQRLAPPPSNSFQVEVSALQFAWYFRYPGADGKYGRTKPELIDASAGGEAAVGLDTDDAASKDDVVAGTLYLPVDRDIDVTLRAQDVIHSFYVPAMRVKQDAVPGLMIHLHFKPEKIGDYEIACAELCGLGHYKMHGMMKVVSQKDFDSWLAQRQAEK